MMTEVQKRIIVLAMKKQKERGYDPVKIISGYSKLTIEEKTGNFESFGKMI